MKNLLGASILLVCGMGSLCALASEDSSSVGRQAQATVRELENLSLIHI